MEDHMTTRFWASLISLAALCPAGVLAQTVTVGGSPGQTQIVVGQNGEVFVGVWIDAQQHVPTTDRAPLDLSLVVDTSGSMAGDKIANARMAAQSLLETLRDGDIVSIYAFSDGVYEFAAPTVVSNATRAQLMQAVSRFEAAGSTNLYGGMATGIARVSQAPATHPVRRVMLISDGMANVGPSDPGSLGDLAARGTEHGIQISAIGVGNDYDERTLAQLAIRSAGRLYHLANASQMANILREEMGLLAQTVATDAYIEVIPAPGVIIIEGLTQGAVLDNGKLRIPVGSVFSGMHRDLLFRARVDATRPGNRPLATARVVYRDSSARAERTAEAPLMINATPDARAAAASRNDRVDTLVATYHASRSQMRAAEALNRGDASTAVRELEVAEAEVRTAATQASAPAARAQLNQQAETLRARRARATSAAASGAPAMRGEALQNFDDAMAADAY
jgi:Ca-activated chloride channel family protein